MHSTTKGHLGRLEFMVKFSGKSSWTCPPVYENRPDEFTDFKGSGTVSFVAGFFS
jgi:hypothetical protein